MLRKDAVKAVNLGINVLHNLMFHCKRGLVKDFFANRHGKNVITHHSPVVAGCKMKDNSMNVSWSWEKGLLRSFEMGFCGKSYEMLKSYLL